MNHFVAYKLLADELAIYHNLAYLDLVQLLGEQLTRTVRGADEVDYSLAVAIEWQSHVDGEIRLHGQVLEAAWSSPHESLPDDRFTILDGKKLQQLVRCKLFTTE